MRLHVVRPRSETERNLGKTCAPPHQMAGATAEDLQHFYQKLSAKMYNSRFLSAKNVAIHVRQGKLSSKISPKCLGLVSILGLLYQ